jgi:hypothetical protein
MVSYTIRQVQEGLWFVDQSFDLYRAELGIRMTVVRLPNGELWLHSPVRFGDNLAAQLSEFGPVRHIVSPSKMHRLFVLEWMAAFPEATHYVAPGMTLRAPGADLPTMLGSTAPREWGGVFELQEILGVPDLNEMEFFHVPSRTLILTDLLFNIVEGDWWTRLFFTLNDAWGRPALTRVYRRFIKDPVAFRGTVDRLQRWDFDRVVVSHGAVIEHDGKAALTTALDRAGYPLRAPD